MNKESGLPHPNEIPGYQEKPDSSVMLNIRFIQDQIGTVSGLVENKVLRGGIDPEVQTQIASVRKHLSKLLADLEGFH